MKRFYTFMMAVLAVSALSAQRTGTVNNFLSEKAGASEDEMRTSATLGQKYIQQIAERGGTVIDFFYEDFAEGLAGNNGFGEWTIEDSGLDGGDDPIWMLADDDSPAGEFSTGISALNSETADNGWMIFDCDLYNTPGGDATVNGNLISPVMDMSELSSVIVEWNQYFRYCCFSPSPLTLEVSIDGGLNWDLWPAHGNFIEDANTLSANPQVNAVDISCLAAGESEVQIRFSYNSEGFTGYTHYFWGLDDVRIYENEAATDMAISEVVNGDIWNQWEYKVTPMEQRVYEEDGGVLVGTIYKNTGNTSLDSTRINIEIFDAEDNLIHEYQSEYFTAYSSAEATECPQYSYDTLYVSTGWEPDTIGKYRINSTISTVGVEYASGVVTMDRNIQYTTDEYGHDDDEDLDVEIRPRDSDIDGLFAPTGYGSFFTTPNDVSVAYGVEVRFGRFSDAGNEFEARLYEMEPGDNINEADYVTYSTWALADEWIPTNVANSEPIYFEFDDAAPLSADMVYFACIISEFDSETELTVFGNADADTDLSTRRIDQTGDGDFIWFTDTAHPAVRLILSERVGVDEIAAQNGVDKMEIYPNPANNTARINYTLSTAKTISVELYDIAGKLIQNENQGTLPAGDHYYELDVRELPAGMYFYSIVADGVKLTKKLSVNR